MADLQLVAMDIKNTLTAAISDLKTDIKAVASHLEMVESASMTHGNAIRQVQQANDTHKRSISLKCTVIWKTLITGGEDATYASEGYQK